MTKAKRLNYPRCFFFLNVVGMLVFLLSNLFCKLQYVK